MRKTLIVMSALIVSGIAGVANAQTPAPHIQPCPVTPCTGSGVPTAAPGGEPGSGPAALRSEPMNSPVATGAGSSSGKGSNGSGSK